MIPRSTLGIAKFPFAIRRDLANYSVEGWNIPDDIPATPTRKGRK